MKKLWILLAASALLCGGCSEDNTDAEGSRDEISVTPSSEITIGPDGGTTEFTVTSSGSWRISGVCDWARPSAVAGKNGDKVTFTVDPNSSDKSMETTFKIFTGSAVAPITITSQIGEILSLVSDPKVELERSKGTLTVRVRTNIPELGYTFSGDGNNWLTFDDRVEGLGGVTLIRFAVTENTDFSPRSTDLTIAGKDRTLVIPITQKQVDVLLVDKTFYEYDLAEQTLSFDVKANVNYVVKSTDWITRLPDTRAVETKTLSFKISQATASRGGSITILATGFDPIAITVVQKDPNQETQKIPDAAFRQKLVSLGYIVDLGGSACIVTDAGLNATVLDCYRLKIKSLEGIAYLKNLTTLYCKGNPLTTVPLGDLNITTLDLSADYYGGNNIVVSGTKLKTLDFLESANLDFLDVSGCPALETLDISFVYYLQKVYLKQGQTIATIRDEWAGTFSPDGKYVIAYK